VTPDVSAGGRVPAPDEAAPRRVPLGVLALGALMVISIAACAVALWRGWIHPELIVALVRRTGSAGMAAYVVAVVALELLWMPRMWGLLAAGALFGPVVGGLLSVVADLLGGSVCYLLARGAGRRWVAELLARRPRASRVVELLAERRGAVTLIVLRMCPVAHYTLVSYAAGLVGTRPRAFLVGTGLGVLPGAVLYPIAGAAALRPGSAAFFISIGAVVVFLVVTLLAARRMLRR
jgi:uncharacterized membrane protein YdjX (TVP38/TMEM64 family)